MNERSSGRIRVLVLAGQPFVLDDVVPEGIDGLVARLTRRPDDVEESLDDFRPHVVFVDTTFPDRGSFAAIERVLIHNPEIRVLALTPEPPPHDQVALAIRAGAVGFVDVGSTPETFVAAVDAVNEGEDWFPADETRQILSAAAGDLDTTAAERRGRLSGVLIALVPLTGLIATLQARMWRKYMGKIGVRPVDLAVDPATRVVDTIAALLLAIAVFGPLLFVGNWLDLLAESRLNRGAIAWLLRRRKTAHVLLSALWLAVAALAAIGPDTVLVVFVGPIVSIAILAWALDAGDDFPKVLRIKGVSTRVVIAGGLTAVLLFFGLLAYETLVVGPDLRTDGEHGYIAPRVLGIRAQPMHALNVDTGEQSDLLYLGGNADLYILVDPCDNDRVDYVSVGAHRLTVIDEITCPDGS